MLPESCSVLGQSTSRLPYLLLEVEGARYLFEWLANGSGTLGLDGLQLIARWEAMDSPLDRKSTRLTPVTQ